MNNDEIRLLLDATITRLKESRGSQFRDRRIFFEVLGDTQDVRVKFYKFLRDVSTCPPKVILWCQEQVNAPR